MVLVTQSFGKECEYRRAIFAIWSAWAHYRKELPVILFTDNPVFFQPYFEEQNVKYVLLTGEKVKKMRGEIDFLHRMKIALIEEAFSITNSDLVYMDSDTFFLNDPSHYFSMMEAGVCHMHLPEYPFSSLRSMPLPAAEKAHAFLDLIENNKFRLTSGEEIEIDVNYYSWNAGIMLLPHWFAPLLVDVYALTDQFYPKTKNHAAEQFSFSIVMQMKNNIKPCEDSVYHYWYRVEKVIMDEWLAATITSQWVSLPLNQKLKYVAKWTVNLPDYLANHILTLRDEAIQAFHQSHFSEGYMSAFRAFVKQPFNIKFVMDVIYHTRRHLRILFKRV